MWGGDQKTQAPLYHSSLLHLIFILEWVLLGIVILAQILVFRNTKASFFSGINGLIFLLFIISGRLPTHSYLQNISLALGELGLVLILGLWGNISLVYLLFIVTVLRNFLRLNDSSRVLMTGLAFVGALFLQTHRLLNQTLLIRIMPDQFNTAFLGLAVTLGLVILFLHLLLDTALKAQERQQELAVVNIQLREYALRIEELAKVQERNRIAREIHDALGHSLMVFSIHLEAALRLIHTDRKNVEILLFELKELSGQLLQDVRQSVSDLRTDPLREQTLETALAELTENFLGSTGIAPIVTIQIQNDILYDMKVIIYRIIQEGLTNIYKHAEATEVWIQIEEIPGHLKIMIRDNGKGFDPQQNTTGFGLQGMRERTFALGGQFMIKTAPQQGCCIDVTFPL